jgi:hypothetical protein
MAVPLDDGTIQALLGDASAAPSTRDGARPWQFRYRPAEGVLQLRVDPERAGRLTDAGRRALHIGSGAALLNLRVAAWHAGLRPEVELLPEGEEAGVLASVRLRAAGTDTVDEELARLRGAIGQRQAGRYPYADRPLPAGLREQLVEQARLEGARLAFPSGWHLALVLDLVEEAEQEAEHAANLYGRGRVRRGVTASSAERRAEDPDGGPGAYGGEGGTGRAPVRDFVRHGAATGWDAPGSEALPQLGLVSTTGDEPRDWLLAGQGMERALLRATAEGLAGSFVTRALERADLRWLLRDPVWGVGPVHMVLRLGYGPA